MKNFIGFLLANGLWILFSLFLTGIDVPIPSSFIALMIAANAIFAFFSIFVQTLVITLYEVNVFEEPKSILDYCFKYFAITTSGINYYVQTVLNRLPFILNKLVAAFFFVFLVATGFSLLGVFN
ncbi:hypothetical protein [Cytobacillus firmus]|uniref:Uncharacterized protein n=1 Tax=Cytobacillus firmus DS1 TaxID=1307436 RepID=W7KZX7_CYTFI|nr:hypothetical protein [Cytobacillus firmus]EWG08836.1 hypothetical protein PBF_22267 [Cytobacillus firmus DS1]